MKRNNFPGGPLPLRAGMMMAEGGRRGWRGDWKGSRPPLFRGGKKRYLPRTATAEGKELLIVRRISLQKKSYCLPRKGIVGQRKEGRKVARKRWGPCLSVRPRNPVPLRKKNGPAREHDSEIKKSISCQSFCGTQKNTNKPQKNKTPPKGWLRLAFGGKEKPWRDFALT